MHHPTRRGRMVALIVASGLAVAFMATMMAPPNTSSSNATKKGVNQALTEKIIAPPAAVVTAVDTVVLKATNSGNISLGDTAYTAARGSWITAANVTTNMANKKMAVAMNMANNTATYSAITERLGANHSPPAPAKTRADFNSNSLLTASPTYIVTVAHEIANPAARRTAGRSLA